MKVLFFLFIVAFFSVAIYLITRKHNSKILTGALIFTLFALFGYFIPLSESNELLLDRIIRNLLPATLFLFLLPFEWKRVFKSGIGCSCTMGAKHYWLIVLLAFATSFVAQLLAYTFLPSFVLPGASLFALLLGIIASFSPLRNLCGSEDIATTMLYLLLAAAAMRIF